MVFVLVRWNSLLELTFLELLLDSRFPSGSGSVSWCRIEPEGSVAEFERSSTFEVRFSINLRISLWPNSESLNLLDSRFSILFEISEKSCSVKLVFSSETWLVISAFSKLLLWSLLSFLFWDFSGIVEKLRYLNKSIRLVNERVNNSGVSGTKLFGYTDAISNPKKTFTNKQKSTINNQGTQNSKLENHESKSSSYEIKVTTLCLPFSRIRYIYFTLDTRDKSRAWIHTLFSSASFRGKKIQIRYVSSGLGLRFHLTLKEKWESTSCRSPNSAYLSSSFPANSRRGTEVSTEIHEPSYWRGKGKWNLHRRKWNSK